MTIRRPLVITDTSVVQLPSGDTIPASSVEGLGDAGFTLDIISAGLSTALNITGAGAVMSNSPSALGSGDGHTLFSEIVDTEIGQLVEVEVNIPYMLISTTGPVMLALWESNNLIGLTVARVTTGATSGNGVALRGYFEASALTHTVVCKIGINNEAHTLTLYDRFSTQSQPYMYVRKWGHINFTSSSGPAPSGGAGFSARKTIAIAGDSVTGQNSGASDRQNIRDVGYMTWALRYCSHRVQFNEQHNFGVGGDTTADLLARFAAVLAVQPDYLVLTIGGNDVTNSIPVEESCNNIKALWEQAAEAGVVVIHGLIYARGETGSYSEAQKQKAGTINNFMLQEAKNHKNVELLSVSDVFTNYDNANGQSHAVYLPDTVHPGVRGACIIGWRLGQLLNKLEPRRDLHERDPSNLYHATANPRGNLVPNGCMLGTGGTLTGSITGDAPSSTIVQHLGAGFSGTLEASVVTNNSVLATQNERALRLVGIGTTDSGIFQLQAGQIATVIPTNQYVVATMQVKVNELEGISGLQSGIVAISSGSDYTALEGFTTTELDIPAMEVELPPLDDNTFIFRSPKVLVSPGTSVLLAGIILIRNGASSVNFDLELSGLKLEIVDA